MAAIDLDLLVDEGLGNSAYIVDLGDGRALTVDASLDLREVSRATHRRGLTVAFAVETHLHADFVSGCRQLAASDGARILAAAAGHREFDHTGLRDGDEIDLGGLSLRALATPGHTDEHLSLLLLDGSTPMGVFTGGSLLVGTAARTDLVSEGETMALARAQYGSLRRLAALPDDLPVWPTHGAGSFCSSPSDADRTTTIGREKATNPLLQVADEDAFVSALLDSMGSYPPYFRRLAEVNRRGPAVLTDDPALPPLEVDRVRSLLADGAQIVDSRPKEIFAERHVPAAVAIALRPSFASWLGWVVDPDRPVVVVRAADQDPAEIVWQATKIGSENLVGELAGGIDAWAAAGLPTKRIRTQSVERPPDHPVLDVRQASEFVEGHLPDAIHVELGDLPTRLDDLPAGPLVTMCSTGERSMTAASLLEAAGRDDVTVLIGGGADEWADHTGHDLETGA
jgi:hydroxyacylglutathione hydrolase